MVRKKQKILNKEIIYLDILKVFACFMVIVNHTNIYILDHKTFGNTLFYCLMHALCKIGVGLFLMITGVLILDKTYSYKKIIHCIFRVFMPCFFLSLLFYIKDTGIHNINIISFLKSFLSTPYILPYWYIYALIGIYLVLPFIQKMLKNFTNQDYVFFILLFLIMPTLLNLFKIYFHISIDPNWQLAFFSVIIAYMICGNYLSKIIISKKYLIIAFIIFIVSYVGLFFSIFFPYLNNGEISYALDSCDAFPVVLMTISLFYIVRYFFENKEYSKRFISIVTMISSTTFGIYLIHTAFNYKLYQFSMMQKLFRFNGIIAITILDFMVFIVCMIIIYILKKISFIKKFL